MKVKIKAKKKWIYNPFKDGLTQSLIEIFRACPVKIRLVLAGWYKPAKSEALIFGNVVHELLDILYTAIKNKELKKSADVIPYMNNNNKQIYKRLLEDYREEDTSVKEIAEAAINKALIIIPLYFDVYKQDFKLNWLELEKVFSFKLLNIPIRGKRDGALYKGKGLWLFETKTKGRYNIESIMKWLINQLQIYVYLWSLCLDYEAQPKGVWYNIIRNPQIKKNKSESWQEYAIKLKKDILSRPEFYFQRIERAIPYSRLEAYISKLIKELERFLEWWKDGIDIPYGSNCESKFGACEFIDVCTSDCKNFDTVQKREDLFPELK